MAGYLEKLKMKKRLPQVLPKLPKGENTPTHGTAKTAQRPLGSKGSKGGRHISENWQSKPNTEPLQDHTRSGQKPVTAKHIIKPAVQKKKQRAGKQDYSQPPSGCSSEYADLWRRAWTLADWIDDPDGAPIEDRRAMLVELNRMRAELVKLEQSGALVTGDESAPVRASDNNGVWVPWESINGGKQITPEQCPARCKKNGKCYAQAYFEGKPGPFPGPECDKDRCSWMPQQPKI